MILNPLAGSADREQVKQLLADQWQKSEYEIYETSEDKRLADVVAAALERGFELIVAAGGDGTVSGVAAGLVNSQ
ncbi:MAG: NAD(+)/NADH kinase, partial [Anaerolineales bacterium]|nr:NAD(+)/NADH kinase [Anaerolineales bacterium]